MANLLASPSGFAITQTTFESYSSWCLSMLLSLCAGRCIGTDGLCCGVLRCTRAKSTKEPGEYIRSVLVEQQQRAYWKQGCYAVFRCISYSDSTPPYWHHVTAVLTPSQPLSTLPPPIPTIQPIQPYSRPPTCPPRTMTMHT
ncbi:unnamed protein product, partial [Meganyctiphanes norvegica]